MKNSCSTKPVAHLGTMPVTTQPNVPSFLGSQQVPCPLAFPRGQKHGVTEADTVTTITTGQFPPGSWCGAWAPAAILSRRRLSL